MISPFSPVSHGRKNETRDLFQMRIMMEMPRKFESYQSPRVSKLEAHRSEIAEMIRLNWPLRKVAEFLKSEHQLEVACSRIWTFCKSRNIVKGRGEVVAQAMPEAPPDSALPSPPVEVPAGDEDISALVERSEEKSPFTKFKPKP